MEFNLWEALLTFLSLLAAGIGFLIKRIITRLDDTEKDMEQLKVKIAENHPSKQEFQQFKNDITALLQQLINPVHSKLENMDNFLRTCVLKRRDD